VCGGHSILLDTYIMFTDKLFLQFWFKKVVDYVVIWVNYNDDSLFFNEMSTNDATFSYQDSTRFGRFPGRRRRPGTVDRLKLQASWPEYCGNLTMTLMNAFEMVIRAAVIWSHINLHLTPTALHGSHKDRRKTMCVINRIRVLLNVDRA